MNTLYWRVNYRGINGWKIKYYFGEEDRLNNYINKRLKFDKIEYKNLALTEVETLEKHHKVKFQIIK